MYPPGQQNVQKRKVILAPWSQLGSLSAFQHQFQDKVCEPSFFQHPLQRSLQTLLSGDAALNRKNAASTSLPAPFQLVQAPNHPLPAKQQSDWW